MASLLISSRLHEEEDLLAVLTAAILDSNSDLVRSDRLGNGWRGFDKVRMASELRKKAVIFSQPPLLPVGPTARRNAAFQELRVHQLVLGSFQGSSNGGIAYMSCFSPNKQLSSEGKYASAGAAMMKSDMSHPLARDSARTRQRRFL